MAWLQLSVSSILGSHLPPTPKLDVSAFQCNDPRQRQRYQRLCRQQCDAHKITQKIKKLRLLGDRFLNGELGLLPRIIDDYHKLHDTTDRL